MEPITVVCQDCGVEVPQSGAEEFTIVVPDGFTPDGREILRTTDQHAYSCHPCWVAEVEQAWCDAGYEGE